MHKITLGDLGVPLRYKLFQIKIRNNLVFTLRIFEKVRKIDAV